MFIVALQKRDQEQINILLPDESQGQHVSHCLRDIFKLFHRLYTFMADMKI